MKWILFDVGNIIFNDDPYMGFVYERLFHSIIDNGQKVIFSEILEEREQLIFRGDGKHHHTLGERYLGHEKWQTVYSQCLKDLEDNYLDHNVLFDSIPSQLSLLSKKYKLGVAANQVKSCMANLETVGLKKYFSLFAISSEIGITKPDKKFFEWIIEHTNCDPGEMIMV